MKYKIKVFFLIISVFLFPLASSASTANFSSTNLDVDAGSNFNVSVDVADLQNATTMEAVLEYNPTKLTFISVEADDNSVMAPLFELGILFATSSFGSLERMSVSVPSASPTTGSGELVKAVFKLANSASGNTDISLYSVTEYREDLSSVDATTGSNLVITATSPNLNFPVRSNALPTGALSYDTTTTNISLTTDIDATCHYATESGLSFDSQTSFENTGTKTHSQSISGLSSGNSYNYYVKCRNEAGDINTDDYLISFTVDSPPIVIPPSGGGGGGGGSGSNVTVDKTAPGPISNLKISKTNEGIELNWKNPNDNDLSKIFIFRMDKALAGNKDFVEAQANSLTSYETSGEDYLDTEVTDYKNYYVFFTKDTNNNLGSAFVSESIEKALGIDTETTPETGDNVDEEDNNNQNDYIAIKSLFGVSGEVVEKVSKQEADKVLANQQFVNLNAETLKVYKKVVSNKNITDQNIKFRIAYFIHYGTPTTQSLGAGERGGVLDSYYSAFSKIPTTDSEWKDVIKIANGRWPTERNVNLENDSKDKIFNIIYKRKANMNVPSDNAAVTVISYGLRPAKRNLESEKTAIIFFKGIFKHNPQNAHDWDTVRAIAYSGAIR